jgi:hypothetical protein
MSLTNDIRIASRDPLHTYEGWLNRDTYAVRREVRTKTTRRTAKPKGYRSFKILRKLGFQGAHAWPLQWGGREVREGLFWAHRVVNGSRQKRIENAVLRLAKRARRAGIKIFVTVEVEKYPQLKLFRSATYRIEAVSTVGGVQRTVLAEATISQNLTQSQINDLVQGRKITLRSGRVVGISAQSIGAAETKLDNLIEGLRRKGPASTTAGARATTGHQRGTLAVHRGSANRGQVPSRALARSTRRLARRAALRAAGRFLVTALGRSILVALRVLNVVGGILLALEVYNAIVSYYREKHIREALLEGLKTQIPEAMRRNLNAHREAIARHYVSAWERAGGNRPLFLYISPRVVIYNDPGPDETYNFKVKLEVKNLLRDFITTRRLTFKREDIDVYERNYTISLRWSVEQPLFTPFDIYLAHIQLVARIVVEEWEKVYIREQRVSDRLARAFHAVVEECARIAVVLRSDAYFGYDPGERSYLKSKAGWQRYGALERLSKRIHDRLIPRIDTLMRMHPIDPEARLVIVTAQGDPLAQEVELQLGGTDLVLSLQQMADQMKANYSVSDLEYLRFETVDAMQNPIRAIGPLVRLGADAHIPDLTDFLAPVLDFLPADLRPPPTRADYFEVGPGVGEVQIERPE